MTCNNGHTPRKTALALLMLAAGWGLSAPAAAQEYGRESLFRDRAYVSADASVHSWSAGGSPIVQRSFPLSISMPVAERALFTIAAVPAAVEQGGGTIGGVPETQFGASYVLPGEKLWLSGSVDMPTGVTRLTREQTELAASIAQPALGFPIGSMGHGLNTRLGCAYATSASRLVVFGFGAAVSTKGAYEPVAPSETMHIRYAPGNEIAANIGIDYRDGLKINRLSADYTVTYYLSDRLNGERFFQSGVKASLVLAASHAEPASMHRVRMRLELRAQNASVSGGMEEKTPSARQLSLLYSYTRSAGRTLSLTGGVEFRTMSSDQFPVNGAVVSTGGGTVAIVSGELRYAAAPWCTIAPRCSFGAGSVTIMSSRHAARGFDLGIGVQCPL
ncbi:MAG: hypothetical protein ACM3Q4_02710 [Acidobacteriota bacterium]